MAFSLSKGVGVREVKRASWPSATAQKTTNSSSACITLHACRVDVGRRNKDASSTSRAATPLDETRSNLKLSKKVDVVVARMYVGMAQPSC